MGGKGSIPSMPAMDTTPVQAPEPPVATASSETAAQVDAREKARKAALAAQGRSGTVLTSEYGDTSTAKTKGTVLGGT